MEHENKEYRSFTLPSGNIIEFHITTTIPNKKAQITNLERCLERAVAREDYESAILVREDIKKLRKEIEEIEKI